MSRTPQMPTITSHSFAQVPRLQIPRSKFRKPYTHKTAFDAGWLIPWYVQEILPGDHYSFNCEHVIRIATLLHPTMSNLYIDFHWFFVPNRLVWENWERFQGAQDNPDDTIDFLVPQLDRGSGFAVDQGSLYDYFDLPTQTGWESQTFMPNALVFRAHNLIWNYWFRDQNLQDSLPVPMTDGPDSPSLYELVKRGKRKDYFTAGLPWPQKGDAVTLPLGTIAPVMGNGMTLGLYGLDNVGDPHGIGMMRSSTAGAQVTDIHLATAYGANVGNFPATPGANPISLNSTLGVTLDPGKSGMVADLSDASAATINALRQAFAIQGILEMYARGGTRYMEILRSQWGVIAHDYRLQYPEFLGYSSSEFATITVPQTSATDGGSPQATLAAYGVQVTHSKYNKSFVEHGHVIGFISVRADQMYQNKLHRMWTRRTRNDFAQPQLANLGEQAVMRREIFFQGSDIGDDSVFAYMPRFDEYRSGRTVITDIMRSNAVGTLDTYHLANNFPLPPNLDGTFIEEDPPVIRIIAAGEDRQFIMDAVGTEYALMSLPVNSQPALLDRM